MGIVSHPWAHEESALFRVPGYLERQGIGDEEEPRGHREGSHEEDQGRDALGLELRYGGVDCALCDCDDENDDDGDGDDWHGDGADEPTTLAMMWG